MEDALRERLDIVDAKFDSVDARFEQVDARFDSVDARFEQVDVRFDQIDSRFEQVDARFDKIDSRFEQVDARFDKIDARFEQVDARLDKIDARFEQVDVKFSEMYRLIVQEGERTRRHFDLVAEGLESRIKLGLEGYSALRADVSDLKGGQQRLEAGHIQLDIRMLAIESRVTGVEKVQKIVLTEVRGLATRIDRLSSRRRPSRRH